MDHRTYSIIELVGVSEYSYDDAARRAIARASDTLEGLGWFKVKELRGLIRNGEVAEYQVSSNWAFACCVRTSARTSAHREDGEAHASRPG